MLPLPIGEHFELYGRIENVTDAQYETAVGFQHRWALCLWRGQGQVVTKRQILSIFAKRKWGGGAPAGRDGGVSALASLPLRQRFALPPPHLSCGKMERIVLAFVPLLLSACAQAPAREAAPAAPRIVSLNPCTDAVLVEVADPQQILALSSYSSDPASSSMDLAVASALRCG